jgi:hypothetical protein
LRSTHPDQSGRFDRMRFMQTLFGIVVSSSLALTPAFAGQRGHQGAPPTPHGAPAVKPATPPHGGTHGSASKPTTSTTTTGTTSTSTTSGATTTTSTTPRGQMTVSQRIAANPKLATRLQTLLPSNMTLETAASGFKNQGQFIAALHVSHNLHIPFADLKAEMTGADHDSLGQAIQQLRPTANSQTATETAEQEANEDVKVTTTTTSTSTTTTPTTTTKKPATHHSGGHQQ